MPRPKKCRRIEFFPDAESFVPTGRENSDIFEYVLKVEELEAMRLKDVEELSQEECAEKMHVSRQTFQNIIECARKKTVLALTKGATLRIAGGNFATKACRILCSDCGHVYDPGFEEDKMVCPKCGSAKIGCVRRNLNCTKWCGR
jgi:predicted DNA-binding protein (UPF0251 family)/rubredoxin